MMLTETTEFSPQSRWKVVVTLKGKKALVSTTLEGEGMKRSPAEQGLEMGNATP